MRKAEGERAAHEKERTAKDDGNSPLEVDNEVISDLSDSDEFDGEALEKTTALLEYKEDKSDKNRKRKRDQGELEDKYMAKLSKEVDGDVKDKVKEDEEAEEEEEAAADTERNPNVDKSKPYGSIESLLPTTETEKAESTIFIGNLSSSVIIDKSKYKQLKRHFSKYGKIASIRFRSIAFSEMLPRKVAFVKHKFHSSRDTVNAYLVFKDKAAVQKSLEANGTMFFGNHIRVDSVAHPAKHDNKRCVFIGNLGFEATEEPLWKHFENCGEIEYIRLIRDSKTNVGKGIGYVQFKDSMSVPKALLLNDKKLDGPAGRKLRITRAKHIKAPSANSTTNKKGSHHASKNPRLSAEEKTKLGRAKSVLGKAGRSEVQSILEGTRAKPGDVVPSTVSKSRKKRPRIRERTKAFKAKLKKD